MDRNALLNGFVPTGSSLVLRFADGSVDLGGVLHSEDEQGQLVPVPATDPLFEVHEQWKREAARKLAATRPNRATRRASKKSRKARRKQKGVQHG